MATCRYCGSELGKYDPEDYVPLEVIQWELSQDICYQCKSQLVYCGPTLCPVCSGRGRVAVNLNGGVVEKRCALCRGGGCV